MGNINIDNSIGLGGASNSNDLSGEAIKAQDEAMHKILQNTLDSFKANPEQEEQYPDATDQII